MNFHFSPAKSAFVVFVMLVLCTAPLQAAEFFTDRGSMWINGEFGYSSYAYDGASGRTHNVYFLPSLQFFPLDFFMLGPRLAWQGAYGHGHSSNALGVGLDIGFAYGKDIPVVPYLRSGFEFDVFFYNGYDDDVGFTIPVAGGVIIPVREHLGMHIEPYFRVQTVDGFVTNAFGVAVGFGGLIY